VHAEIVKPVSAAVRARLRQSERRVHHGSPAIPYRRVQRRCNGGHSRLREHVEDYLRS
jgi:hypothetical protein